MLSVRQKLWDAAPWVGALVTMLFVMDRYPVNNIYRGFKELTFSVTVAAALLIIACSVLSFGGFSYGHIRSAVTSLLLLIALSSLSYRLSTIMLYGIRGLVLGGTPLLP